MSARASVETPVGPVWVAVQDGVITEAGWGTVDGPAEDPVLIEALRQLSDYFEGQRETFDLPIAHGRTGLQAAVLDALRRIPFGETRTYGDLATEIDAPAQAIGQACGANCIPILIPCHRVLAATSLGGFSAPGGIKTKVWLLRHERAAGLLI